MHDIRRFDTILVATLFFSLMFFAAVDGVCALQSSVWRRVTSGQPLEPVLVHDDGSISLLADDRNLYRFSPDGSLTFRLALRTRNDRLIAGLPDGSVLLGRADGSVTRISHRGAISWTLLPADRPVERAAVSNTGFIVLVYADGGLRMVTFAGHEIWSRAVGSSVRFGPFLDERGRLLLITEAHELLVLGSGGDVRFSYDLESLPSHAVLRPDGHVLAMWPSGEITRIDPDNGQSQVLADSFAGAVWLQTDGAGMPVVLQGHVLGRLDQEGRFHEIASGVQSAASAGVDRFVVVDSSTRMRVLDSAGQLIASIRVDDAGHLSEPVAGRNGHIAVIGSHWVIFGFQVVPSDQIWWSGSAGSGVRDFRVGQVRGESRAVWRQSTEFQFFEGMAHSGLEREKLRVLDELESRAQSGSLGSAYSYASHILGVLVADSRTSGLVRPATLDIVRRGYELLAWIGDTQAHAVIDRGVQLYRDDARIEILMQTIAEIGYSHRVDRHDVLLALFQRNSSSGRVQNAYIEALRVMREQGYDPPREAIRVLTGLSVTGANAEVRDRSREFIQAVAPSN